MFEAEQVAQEVLFIVRRLLERAIGSGGLQNRDLFDKVLIEVRDGSCGEGGGRWQEGFGFWGDRSGMDWSESDSSLTLFPPLC